MPRFHGTPNGNIQFTAEEELKKDAEEKAWNDASADRKLAEIKQIRLEKLQETDWYSNSDVTMPDNIKTWRQSLRNIPTNYDSSKYDELLNVETDKAKDNFGKLTHSIWSKP